MNDVTATAEEYLKVRGLGVRCEDFYAYMPQHTYIFIPTRDFWPAASVNARCAPPSNPDGSRVVKSVPKQKKGGATEWVEVPMSPTEWLDEHRACDQMAWVPGEEELIRDRLVVEGGWVRKAGVSCFNLYLPPVRIDGSAAQARPWLRHLLKVFPSDARHIVQWLAFKVQHPGVKINHALVLTGEQRIGKDSILEPVKHAVGPWNFKEVSPKQLVGRFNGFLKSVILRVSEAHDLGELDRFGFYECLKTVEAAPPDVLRCDEKNLRGDECCGGDHHNQRLHKRHLSPSRRSPSLRGGEPPDERGLHRGLLEAAVGMV